MCERKSTINQSQKAYLGLGPSIPFILINPKQDKIKQLGKNSKLISRVYYYDWNSAIRSMIDKMLKIQNINHGSVLLIDNINIDNINIITNDLLNISEVMEIIYKVLENSSKFIIISAQQLSLAREKLGLSPQDSLNMRSKVIGIANSLGAHYILYSNIKEEENAGRSRLQLQMQLMLVSSGEIVWSSESMLKQQ